MRRARRLAAVAPVDTGVEHRDLADYDRMFGLDTTTDITTHIVNTEGVVA